MKRIVTCIAAGATLATTAATPVIADGAMGALRLFGSLVEELERGRRYSAPRYYDDYDDDGRFHRGHVRTYRDDDDDDGRRRGHGRRWNDDDD